MFYLTVKIIPKREAGVRLQHDQISLLIYVSFTFLNAVLMFIISFKMRPTIEILRLQFWSFHNTDDEP